MMPKKPNVPCETISLTVSLPKEYMEEIGRIIVSYARLEAEMRQLLYRILSIQDWEADICLRGDAPPAIIKMMADIMEIRHPDKDLMPGKSLEEKIQRAAFLRNSLAHGVWTKRIELKTGTEFFCLAIKTGKQWSPEGSNEKFKSRTAPRIERFDRFKLNGWYQELMQIVKAFTEYNKHVSQELQLR